MNENQRHTIERHCDVAIIGGSAAGLAAALQLGRQCRSVIVIDAEESRNSPATHMHSYLGHEGVRPGDFAAIARADVRRYGVEVLAGRALTVTHADSGGFRIELVGGNAVVARRVLAATGLVDVLPEIDGLAEHWGSAVIHCPFCHGYEVRDRRIVQIITHPIGLHSAGLFRQLAGHLTIVLHGEVSANDVEVRALRDAGVTILDQPVSSVRTDDAGRLTGIELDDDRHVEADALAIATHFEVRVQPFEQLGLATAPHPSGLGDVVVTDAAGATSIPGVYAAGNVTDPFQQVLQAAAGGSSVAGTISRDLAHEDIEAATRSASNQRDWEQRYRGDQIWSGNPNGTLVNEANSLTPGRALDVGAGEGGDAVWLAERGWSVTATDISHHAIDRIVAQASERALDIEVLQADANALGPFEAGTFELVAAHYLSIPRTPDDRALHNILRAVAPGGTLLVVGHDLTPRSSIDTHERSQLFDPNAYVGVDDFVDAITDSTDWDLVVHETRPRPEGSATAAHHANDVVLRAHRRTSGAPR